MNSSSFKPIPAAVAVILVAACAFQARSAQSSFATAGIPPAPLGAPHYSRAMGFRGSFINLGG